jgi:hypothetical protein
MKGQMRILNSSGDSTVTWSPEVAEEVKSASDIFEELVQQHYTAYAFKVSAQPGEVITRFEPGAQKIIMAPRMAGG